MAFMNKCGKYIPKQSFKVIIMTQANTQPIYPGLDAQYLAGFRDIFKQHIQSVTQYDIFAPPEIYHYTDVAGVNGIIAGNDLWLNQAQYSNDAAEVDYGYQLARETIASQLETEADPERRDYLERLNALADKPTTDVYICCFCAEDNLLSQWRGYGANGAGFSLGFRSSEFEYVAGPDAPIDTLLYLWQVFYKLETQRRILEQAINLAFSYDDLPNLDNAGRVYRAKHLIDFFVPTLKNPDFSGENEYRMIFVPQSNFALQPSFRVSKGMIVPYYSLQTMFKTEFMNSGFEFKLPIFQVCVGPGINKDLNAASVRRLLKQHGFKNPDGSDVPVVISNTPYRGS
jgi:hypothetical protein